MTIPVAQANGEMPDTAHVVSQEGSASVKARAPSKTAVERIALARIPLHTVKHAAAMWPIQSAKDLFKIPDFFTTSLITSGTPATPCDFNSRLFNPLDILQPP
jgi:hypothetical protein